MLFKRLVIENLLYYREACLDLDFNGITVLRGINHNTKSKRSNGAGKSLLVGSIGNVLYDSLPLIKRPRFNSSISVAFSLNDEYTVIKSKKYRILKNGSDLGFATNTHAQKYLKDILPLTEEEYYTFVHLDPRRPFLFQLGTPTQRFQALSNCFRLDFEDILTWLRKRLNEKLAIRSQYEMLTNELNQLRVNKRVKQIFLYLKKKKQEWEEYEQKKQQYDLWNEIQKRTNLPIPQFIEEASRAYQEYLDYQRKIIHWREYKRIIDTPPPVSPDQLGEWIERTIRIKEMLAERVNQCESPGIDYQTARLNYHRAVLLHEHSQVIKQTHTCPVCGSKVTNLPPEQDLHKLKRVMELAKKYEKYTKWLDLQKYRQDVEKLPFAIQWYQAWQNPVPKPKKPPIYDWELLKQLQSLKELPTPQERPIPPNISKEKVLRKYTEYQYKYWEYLHTKKRRQELLDRRKRLIDELQDIQAYQALIHAYSTKGLKYLMIKKICEHLELLMNKYSPLIYPERFTFQFDIQPTQFHIIVKRKSGEPCDVKHLSGAESRAFTLLYIMCIYQLLPEERKTNLLILDEICNFDPPGMDMVVNQFLPELNLFIPHIIVVSTDQQEYPNSRVITVEKYKNEARLT